jgi:hypothetical protein
MRERFEKIDYPFSYKRFASGDPDLGYTVGRGYAGYP